MSESAVARPALEALLDAVAGVLAAGSLEDTLRRIADRLGALVRFDDLAVYEIDPDAQELQPVFAVGRWAAEVMAERIPLGAGVTGWVVRNRRTRSVPDSSRDPLVEVVAGTDDHPVRVDHAARRHARRRGAQRLPPQHRGVGGAMRLLTAPDPTRSDARWRLDDFPATAAVLPAGEQHGLLELYRSRPQAFSAAEVDRARLVALQFAPLLERLGRD